MSGREADDVHEQVPEQTMEKDFLMTGPQEVDNVQAEVSEPIQEKNFLMGQLEVDNVQAGSSEQTLEGNFMMSGQETDDVHEQVPEQTPEKEFMMSEQEANNVHAVVPEQTLEKNFPMPEREADNVHAEVSEQMPEKDSITSEQEADDVQAGHEQTLEKNFITMLEQEAANDVQARVPEPSPEKNFIMSGRQEADDGQVGLPEQRLEEEGEADQLLQEEHVRGEEAYGEATELLQEENIRREEIYQGSTSWSPLSSSDAPTKHLDLEDSVSSRLLQDSELGHRNVPENLVAPPSSPATPEMETTLSISPLAGRSEALPDGDDVMFDPPVVAYREAPPSINLEEDINSANPQPPLNAPPQAPPPSIRNIYGSEARPSQPPGIGSLFNLYPPPHLAYEHQYLPAQSLFAPMGSTDMNGSTTAPAVSGNFILGSLNVPPPPLGVDNNSASSTSSSSFWNYQLPQLSLSANVQDSAAMDRPPYNRATARSSSISIPLDGLPTNNRRPLEAGQGSFMIGRPLEAGEPSSRPSKAQVTSWPTDMNQPSAPNVQLPNLPWPTDINLPSANLQLYSWSNNPAMSANLHPSSWNNIPAPAPTSQTQRPRFIPNSLYDPRYEAMGLPIDPHLRLFLAWQNRENTRNGHGDGNA
ncbi:hypothetical protein CDL15_Pgr018224 [Punica granatum]|uniref:Uncharacterized protein n=1 Tax=Punica granatum TaxID=22663 RepID=A0A218WIN4_PUNGR|nr:hypothetical protein CDL15_Pgr018224 [Punica granatum]